MNITMADWKATRRQRKLVKEVLKSGRLTYGDKTRELEERFANIHHANHALFTSSGTSALKIALGMLKEQYNWQDGDEVIIPAVTFVATMNVVIMNNLTPVLVDVLPDTVNMDPSKLEAAINERTRCILPVHLLGQPADMDSIMEIAKARDLRVVEDSCETMFVNEIRGDVICFSSYLAHLLVTGVGGFIVTNDKDMATVMRSMMFHGRDESYLSIDDNPDDISKRFWFPRFGYSDRMTELEAALGLAELDGWEKMIKTRQDNAEYLIGGLTDGVIDGEDSNKVLPIKFPITDVSKHSFMFFPMLVEHRNALMLFLEKNGIQTRTMMPLTTQPVVQPYFVPGSFPVADDINERGLLIGCHQYLGKKELEYIIEKIKEFYS